VPGSPMDPRCRGSNRLVRQGATLIQDADDVLEILEPMLNRPASWQLALWKDSVRPVQGAIGAAPETPIRT
jgi:predicted Rossmann fold nucleotide-binding protein DprA/Smf involved in DNA uptake